jgi:hypothetical protein
MQEFEDLEEDMNNLGEDCLQPHLTRQYYESSLKIEQRSNEDRNTNNTEDPTCQVIVDTIMAELQNKYNLRSKTKNITTTQPKKIMPRGEVYEPTPKETETQNTKIKGVDLQGAKTKTTETHTSGTKKVENKMMQTNKLEKKEIEVQIRETDKNIGGFSLENEINKIKIPIPLVEIAKNPIYRKQIAKMINFSDV